MARVVITGAGTVNPLGMDVDATLAAMVAGRVAIGPLDIPDAARLSSPMAAQVKGWEASRRFDTRRLALYDRATQFALVAAEQAVAQSGLEFSGDLALRSGVIMGTAGGGHGTVEDSYRAVFAEGRDRVHPFTVPRLMPSAPVSHISMVHGIQGPAFTVSSACASSNHALGLAFQMVRGGMAPVMLAGGADAMLGFGGLKAWEGLRVMSPDACRPFSQGRNGMVQGEGAAVFVLEDRDHALARGADILAEVAGFGMAADAGDIVLPSPDGAALVMRRALEDAGEDATVIGYINAHGTGTAANDKSEAAAIRAVFGAHPPPVSSTKSMHGHLIGAAGAVELLACILALRDGVLPPTMGYLGPDPDCDLDVIPLQARKAAPQYALSNAFAFGGLNAALILRAP